MSEHEGNVENKDEKQPNSIPILSDNPIILQPTIKKKQRMYEDLHKKKYDYLILGTSLAESIVSSYLSKNQKTVLHLDLSKFYGGDCLNMNLREFDNFTSKENYQKNQNLYFKDMEIFDIKNDLEKDENTRSYNLDFNLKLLYSKSIATTELANSSAASYIEFMPIHEFSIYSKDMKILVPTSKSEIFISQELDLIEKQMLFNFLLAINKIKPVEDDLNNTDEFKKNTEVENIFIKMLEDNMDKKIDDFLEANFIEKLRLLIKHVLGGLSLNQSDSNLKVKDLIDNIHKYLMSVNVFSKSPFLYAIYGSSEFAQAMCRISSVYRSIFIINNNMKLIIRKNNISPLESNYFVSVSDCGNLF